MKQLSIKESSFLAEIIVVVMYSLNIFIALMSATQVIYAVPWNVISKVFGYITLIGLSFCFVVIDKYTLKAIVKAILILFLSFIVAWQSGATMSVITVFMFIVSGMHLRTDLLFKAYVIICSFVIIFTLFMYATGIYYHDYTGGTLSREVRLYLGFTYTTYLPNIYFHLTLCYFALKKKNITLTETLIVVIVNYIIFVCTDTRAVYYELILFLFILWIIRLFPNSFDNSFFKIIMTITMPVLALVIIYLSYNYNSADSFYVLLNELTTGRLLLGKEAISRYGFSAFGTYIIWSTPHGGLGEYFYVDSSYLNIALNFGIVVIVLIILGFSFLGYRAHKEKRFKLCSALLLLALHSFSDPQLFELRYDPFLILIGTVCLSKAQIPVDNPEIIKRVISKYKRRKILLKA